MWGTGTPDRHPVVETRIGEVDFPPVEDSSLKRFTAILFLVALTLLAGATPAEELRPFRLSVSTGLGGSFDSEADTSFDNSSFQLGFAWARDHITLVGVRYGQLDLDSGTPDLFSAELTYVTIAGEYVFSEGYYESGLYLGLGIYELDGSTSLGPFDETAVGLTVGVTGEFPITARWAILLEISGHYADISTVRLFAMGHAGLAYRF